MSARLQGLRAFFRGLQKYSYEIDGRLEPHLEINWNPADLLATPEQVMTQIQPNPRNVEEEAWLKLVWTACTLNAEMVKEAAPRTTYPLLLQRAVALVWVTGCRRSDEIRRLPLECVRESGGHQRWLMNRESSLKRQSIFGTCTFQVTNIVEIFGPPSRSTQQRLSWPGKPSDPKISRCSKTAKRENSTPYLFQYRRKKIGEAYITDHLIPLLCKAAGLTDELGKAYQDAIGPITSHRARSSTAYYRKRDGNDAL
jgi:hypothetical protein